MQKQTKSMLSLECPLLFSRSIIARLRSDGIDFVADKVLDAEKTVLDFVLSHPYASTGIDSGWT